RCTPHLFFRSRVIYFSGCPASAELRRDSFIFIRRKDLRMSPTDLAVQEREASGKAHRVVNDFSIQIATINGSGSQTANMVLLRSILLMGVPVSGKNMFPSNIAGLPTWYTIRASKRHYIA